MSTTGQPGRGCLAQTELAADTPAIGALPLPFLNDQRIPCGGIAEGAVGIEFGLAAGYASPA